MTRWETLTAVAVFLVTTACFSERSTGPAVVLGGECVLPIGANTPGTRLALISNFAFLPGALHVKSGETVTWLNCAPADEPAHTVTADGGAFSSAPLAPGQAYSLTFSQPGTFAYHCEPHPFMTGQLVVDP